MIESSELVGGESIDYVHQALLPDRNNP
jgi:hypothetical protein